MERLLWMVECIVVLIFFFNDTATTEIYTFLHTLSLHDALPILQGVSRGLAKVLAGTGVTVNTILPGPTRTEGAIAMIGKMAADRGVSPSEMEALFLAENRPSTLIRRFATPEEVASLCVYAASPQASATTGSALRVEGGKIGRAHV